MNMGTTLHAMARVDEARARFQKVVELPDDYDGIKTRDGVWRAGAYFNLGKLAEQEMYRACGASESSLGLGSTAVNVGMYPADSRPSKGVYFQYFDRAEGFYAKALALRPTYVEAASHL